VLKDVLEEGLPEKEKAQAQELAPKLISMSRPTNPEGQMSHVSEIYFNDNILGVGRPWSDKLISENRGVLMHILAVVLALVLGGTSDYRSGHAAPRSINKPVTLISGRGCGFLCQRRYRFYFCH
jgi:hypothetical protein